MRKILLLALAGLFFISACRYEFGGFSLKTKKGRLANTWKVDEVMLNGNDATDSLGNFIITFTRSGDVTYTETLQGASGDSLVSKKGIWEFNDRGVNVVIVFTGNGVTEALIWEILKLHSAELWVRVSTDSVNILEYYFVPK